MKDIRNPRRLLAVAALFAGAVVAATATAANTAHRADSGSGAFADQIYWMDWSGYSSTADGTTPFEFDLADGSKLALDLTRSGSGSRKFEGVCSPTWYSSATSSSAMGVIGYTWNSYPGACSPAGSVSPSLPNVVLYPTDGSIVSNVTFTLSNITLTNPRGESVDEFEVIVADGESLDGGDGANASIVFQTNGGNWKQLERMPAADCGAQPCDATHRNGPLVLPGVGTTTATESAQTTPVAAWLLTTAKPASGSFTVSTTITSGAKQGIMLGMRWGAVRLTKNIVGRGDPSDQFVYRILNNAPSPVSIGRGACTTALPGGIGDCTTSGTALGAQDTISASVMPGNVVTLTEQMAAGSASTLAQYVKTIQCTNSNAGSATPLPGNGAPIPFDPANPPTIDVREADDLIDCVITNAVQADVAIAKAGPAAVEPGAPISYTLTISNNGPGNASGASFGDVVPAAIGAVAASCGAVTGGAVCNNADIGVAGNAVSGTIAALPAGASAQIKITGTAPASGQQLHNAAHVDPPAGVTDPQPGNNDDGVDTEVLDADMAATIVLPPSANAGDPVHGTFACTNNGPSAAANPSCSVDGLPPDAVVSCTPPLPIASLPAGSEINCTVDFIAPGSGPLTGIATAGSGTPDTNPANNTDTATLVIVPVAHLAISKTGTTSLVAGNDATYTITVSNSGPSDATGVMLEDPSPGAGIAFVSATVPCAGGFPCTLGTIVAGASVPVTATFHVAANYAGPSPFTNTASAWSPTDPAHGSPATPVQGSAQTTVGAAPDLAIAKHHDGDFHQGQVGATYSIVVGNVGAGPTTGPTTVTETLPAGLAATAIAGGGWTCTLSPLGCSRADVLAAGASWPAIVLTVDVADDATNLVNAAGVDTPDDPNPANDEVEDPTTIVASADIAVRKSVDDDAPVVGQTITFTIVATNNGPSPATNVVVSDGLPAGLAFVSATPSQGSYDQASGNWTIPGPLAVGDGATMLMQAQVLAPGSIVNTATRTGGDQVDPNSSNNSGSAPINSAPAADVQVQKTVDNATPPLGGDVTFQIRVHNAGPSDATGVVVGDVLPAGLAYVSSIASVGSYDAATGRWTIGNLANGATVTLDLVVSVTTTDPVVNTASVVDSDQFDPDPSNNQDGVAVNGEAADIQVVKTADNANVTLGDPVTYTITVTNNGPDATTGVGVTDPLPAGLEFVSATASQGSYDAPSGLWTIGNLDASGPGATVTLTVRATVTAITEIVNVATSNGSDLPDPVDSNNSDQVPIHGAQLPPPTAQKAFEPATAPAGATVQMTITLNNPNATALTGVGFADTYPAGLVNGSAPVIVSNDCGGSVTAAAGAGSLMLAGGTIAANTSCAIIANVVGASEGALVNTTGPITSDNALPGDPPTGTFVVTPSADVSIAKTGPVAVEAGASISWTLAIANAGPSAADGTSFSDVVPAGVTGVSARCGTVSGGAACSDADIAVAGNLVTGTIATLPNGGSVLVVVTGTAPTAGGTLHNGAHVDPPTGTHDPDPDDNDSGIDTDVGANADLSVTKAGSASVLPGGQVAYTIVVRNAGPSAAENARLADPTPAGLVFVSATAPCAGGFPCALGTLAAGASVSVEVVYDVPVGYAGANPIVNTATASSDTPDPDPSNDSDSADTPVGTLVPPADLSLRKTANAASVRTGAIASWTIVVRNAGPGTATGVRITDMLPPGLADAATSGCAEDPAGVPTCTLGTLAAGAQASITISARVTAGSGSLANHASVVGDEPDPTPDNNDDTSTVVVDVGGDNPPAPVPVAESRTLALLAALCGLVAMIALRRRRGY